MEASFLTTVLLPLALFIIMLGMGLSLVVDDFKRVLLFPKAVAVGVILKVLIVPLIMILGLKLVPISPDLAVGFILLAACPGGATSNLITNLARGDVALSITLTAIASALTVLTIPLFVNLGMTQFMGENTALSLPFLETVGKILAVTIIPVVFGMIIHRYAPKFSAKAEKPVKLLSAIFLVAIIVAALAKEWDKLPEMIPMAGPAALILNIVAMALGFGLGHLFKLEKSSKIALSVETGIVNGTLGITIAAGILQNSVMTIPSAIYSLIMFPMVGFVIYYGNRPS